MDLRLALALTLLAAAPAAAQGTIQTDRPGFGFNSALVGPAVVQVEVGVPEVQAGGGVELYSFPALLRVGVSDRVELRAGASLYDAEGGADGDIGFDNVELGAKVAVRDGADGGPGVALIPAVTVSTEGGGASASVDAVAGWALPGGFGLTTVTGVDVADDEATFALVGVVSRGLTDALGGYVEAAVFPGPADDVAYVGGGVTYLATSDLQFDAFVDVGLTDASEVLLFGLGVSTRF